MQFVKNQWCKIIVFVTKRTTEETHGMANHCGGESLKKENAAMDVVVEQIFSEQLMSEEFLLIVFQEESLFVLLESMNVAIQIVWGVVRKNSM